MSYGYMRNASAMYQQTRVQGGVEDADRHQLTQMLLDGAIERIVQARGMLGLGDMAGKGQQITKAIAIVNELRGSLDHKVDPSLSGRLESLYEYVTRRLLHGQLNNDAAALDESMQLLAPVRDGWRAIRGEYLAGAKAVAGAA